MKQATRADDDVLLAMLADRLEIGSADVGAKFGRSPEYVRTATNRVRDADVAACAQSEMSEDAAGIVAAAYQWRVT